MSVFELSLWMNPCIWNPNSNSQVEFNLSGPCQILNLRGTVVKSVKILFKLHSDGTRLFVKAPSDVVSMGVGAGEIQRGEDAGVVAERVEEVGVVVQRGEEAGVVAERVEEVGVVVGRGEDVGEMEDQDNGDDAELMDSVGDSQRLLFDHRIEDLENKDNHESINDEVEEKASIGTDSDEDEDMPDLHQDENMNVRPFLI
ncbi:hypothetical protein DAPPUDRAFT_335889 [Daphnia pulex]|uniref:Uncharacterized protein n=1 Tax=Daphnia pulex TaxID=6669 RepID=E9HYP1_DAPPU|nr:hypothetical protein DAPPUDRAFT_335889 [Daphnia pulex]|eukprot:EFX63138.1 hypothetical protein DAPPUDRAFT_335889 [Daphnia pulex]